MMRLRVGDLLVAKHDTAVGPCLAIVTGFEGSSGISYWPQLYVDVVVPRPTFTTPESRFFIAHTARSVPVRPDEFVTVDEVCEYRTGKRYRPAMPAEALALETTKEVVDLRAFLSTRR